jgi:hypothetical protein
MKPNTLTTAYPHRRRKLKAAAQNNLKVFLDKSDFAFNRTELLITITSKNKSAGITYGFIFVIL